MPCACGAREVPDYKSRRRRRRRIPDSRLWSTPRRRRQSRQSPSKKGLAAWQCASQEDFTYKHTHAQDIRLDRAEPSLSLSHPMQPPSVRLVCRARNSFSPSTALWQHFVVPNQHLLRHGRYSSSVAAATQDTTTTNTEHHAFSEATAAEKPHIEPEGNQDTTFPIRKVRTVYSNFVRSKRTASIHKNFQEKLSAGVAASQESMAAIGQLLIDTTDSYAKGKSYQGVAVKPVVSEIGIKPRFLPWCIPVAERPPDAMDRYVQSISSPVGHSDPENADLVVRSSYSMNT
jgi:hypothetical protein